VEDDGLGFDTKKEYLRNGLKNMTKRSEKIGGELQISSQIGIGTQIILSV
jgi:signal transduction histidine kinase